MNLRTKIYLYVFRSPKHNAKSHVLLEYWFTSCVDFCFLAVSTGVYICTREKEINKKKQYIYEQKDLWTICMYTTIPSCSKITYPNLLGLYYILNAQHVGK